MQLMTFKILAASTGWKYTEKELVEKIDFVMTDSTSHDLGVIEEGYAELQTDSVPDSLVCHIHPVMMFQRKIKAVWQEIHDAFGANTIKECFLLTNVDFCNESCIYKTTCLCSFIKEHHHQQHFDVFISLKKNESVSLKDHCFNRVFDCCINILYQLDDIKLYLDKYSNILNSVEILDR